jgi:predicted regulator of Ras-like GTPase activity (Roadblock/LC7/MglB family)
MKPQELTIGQKAKSILLERGWRQGFWGAEFSKLGRLCMMEALSYAAQDVLLAAATTDLFGLAEETAQRLGFRSVPEAMDWNDAPGRTFEQVLERLDRV